MFLFSFFASVQNTNIQTKTLLISGHLPSVPLTLPSEAIARCLKTFLSCLDREGGDLANKTKSCYSEFQNCSGSIIVITRQGLCI